MTRFEEEADVFIAVGGSVSLHAVGGVNRKLGWSGQHFLRTAAEVFRVEACLDLLFCGAESFVCLL